MILKITPRKAGRIRRQYGLRRLPPIGICTRLKTGGAGGAEMCHDAHGYYLVGDSGEIREAAGTSGRAENPRRRRRRNSYDSTRELLDRKLLTYRGTEYWITKDSADIYRRTVGKSDWRWFSRNNESWRKFVNPQRRRSRRNPRKRKLIRIRFKSRLPGKHATFPFTRAQVVAARKRVRAARRLRLR